MKNTQRVVLPITVLVHEGIMARTYLFCLRQAGFIPASIILMVYSNDPQSGKPIGRWFPSGLRMKYARKVQDLAQIYWPRKLKKEQPILYKAMTKTISEYYGLSLGIYNEILGPINFEKCAESFQTLMVKDFNDSALSKSISQLEHKTILFTGGGILPPSLLALPGVKFIHVHPGFLPYVRGSDGLLWSALIRNKPGVSVFYMDPEIDGGKIISAGEISPLTFPVSKEERPDDQTLYRLIFSYYDPMLRAQKLVEVLNEAKDPANLLNTSQDMSKGLTYRFMHPAIRNVALRLLFPNNS